MPVAAYRLTSNADPEERLEEAALWKALHDEYGDAIVAVPEGERAPKGLPVFGRPLRFGFGGGLNPVSNNLPYWNDPAFLAHAGRRFSVCEWEEVEAAVAALHADGLGAFLKSTRSKHAIFRIPVGSTVMETVQDMAYSFLDGGPALMVQEMCDVTFEHRFFCIDRTIVTDSPVQPALTPLDFPLAPGTTFRTPQDRWPVSAPEVTEALRKVAEEVADAMEPEHASIDCAMVNGKPAVIELNPMRLGQLGLYAADVRALARASHVLLANPSMDDGFEGSALVVNGTPPRPEDETEPEIELDLSFLDFKG